MGGKEGRGGGGGGAGEAGKGGFNMHSGCILPHCLSMCNAHLCMCMLTQNTMILSCDDGTKLTENNFYGIFINVLQDFWLFVCSHTNRGVLC